LYCQVRLRKLAKCELPIINSSMIFVHCGPRIAFPGGAIGRIVVRAAWLQ